MSSEGGRSPARPRPSPTITDLHGKPKKRPEYPIGTVALYGPNDKITTKIAASVIKSPNAEPILERWVATDVTTSPKVQREIKEFFERHGVKSIAMSEGNMGCPHEEGEDFLMARTVPSALSGRESKAATAGIEDDRDRPPGSCESGGLTEEATVRADEGIPRQTDPRQRLGVREEPPQPPSQN